MMGAILGTVISPSDGGHWLHAFPFSSDKFSIREGDIPLGWSPDTDSRLDECDKSYYVITRPLAMPATRGGGSATYRRLEVPLPNMRDIPEVTAIESGGTLATIAASKNVVTFIGSSSNSVTDMMININSSYDATIKLNDVTDDAEHRVVWG